GRHGRSRRRLVKAIAEADRQRVLAQVDAVRAVHAGQTSRQPNLRIRRPEVAIGQVQVPVRRHLVRQTSDALRREDRVREVNTENILIDAVDTNAAAEAQSPLVGDRRIPDRVDHAGVVAQVATVEADAVDLVDLVAAHAEFEFGAPVAVEGIANFTQAGPTTLVLNAVAEGAVVVRDFDDAAFEAEIPTVAICGL